MNNLYVVKPMPIKAMIGELPLVIEIYNYSNYNDVVAVVIHKGSTFFRWGENVVRVDSYTDGMLLNGINAREWNARLVDLAEDGMELTIDKENLEKVLKGKPLETVEVTLTELPGRAYMWNM